MEAVWPVYLALSLMEDGPAITTFIGPYVLITINQKIFGSFNIVSGITGTTQKCINSIRAN